MCNQDTRDIVDMIRTTGSVGSDGKKIVWFFVIGYWGNAYSMSPIGHRLNTKGAKTFFFRMMQREKTLYEEQEKKYGTTAANVLVKTT